MKKETLRDKITQGFNDLFFIWWEELKSVFKDQGVIIFLSLIHI